MKFVFTLLLTLPLFAQADWAKIPSKDFSLPPFPSEGSAAHRRDFEQLHRYEKSRSEADCALSRRQEHPTFRALFAIPESPLSTAEAGRFAALVDRAMQLSERIAGYHKGKFLRPRPYDSDPTLTPCAVKPGGSRAYPSSHAAAAAMGACVLAAALPGKAKPVLAFGARLAELRAVSGVHHPSDVAAGEKLGREVCARVLEDAEFRRELEAL